MLAELAVKPMLHMKDSVKPADTASSSQDLEWEDSDPAELESSEVDSESQTLLCTSTDTVER